MIKPIFIIKLPFSVGQAGLQASQEAIKLSGIKEDYHVFAVMSDADEVSFEAFYEKDFTHIKFKKLEELIKNLNTNNDVK